MKKGEGDVFKQFRDSFDKMDGHFHILEQRVPVELQMDYFKYSEKLRLEDQHVCALNDEGIESVFQLLQTDGITKREKRRLLTILAVSKSVKSYRLLQNYVKKPDPEVLDWAYMALMESRISLESELSDEKQIYISTGLGGKNDKLRFYVLILSANTKVFEEYQRQTIEREFYYYLPKENCEIERLTIGDQYVDMLFLVPVRADIKTILDRIIYECNQYGHFLSDIFTITNVKELSPEEVEQIIKKKSES